MKSEFDDSIISMRMTLLLFSLFSFTLLGQKPLRLSQKEKASIIKAFHSGSRFYALSKGTMVFDLIKQEKWPLEKNIVAAFFNEPTLSGHRYMRTNGKIRFIVRGDDLKPAQEVLRLFPSQDISSNPSPLPRIPVELSFEK